MEEENNHYDTRSIILSALNEENNERFLEKCYFIYETTKRTADAKRIKNILSQPIIREIKLIESIKQENDNKIHYYEDDNQSMKKLRYRQETEEQIRTIRNKELATIAAILAELNEEEELTL